MNAPIQKIPFLLCFFLLCSCATAHLPAQKESAMELYQQGRYQEAAVQFAALVEDVPKDADLWFLLGNAQARAGHPKLAVDAYENALLRNPDLPKAWFNLGIIHMQQALKAMIDIQKYAAPDDPIAERASKLGEALTNLLQEKSDIGQKK